MSSIDATTWNAIGLTLTAVGLVISYLVWLRRGAAAGLRGVAWSLLPAAAGLTGTLRLLWDIGDLVVNWALHLVFSPVVWLGISLAGVSAVLFVVSAAMRARGAGVRDDRREVTATGREAARAPGQPTATSSGGKPGRRSRGKEVAPVDDDMADIEAILRKHGIS